VLEPGPASFSALRTAAELAARLRMPLAGHLLSSRATDTVRGLIRLSRIGRRRGVEHVLVRSRRATSLAAISHSARSAALLVIGRALGLGRPGLRRRLALGRVLRGDGPPVLVVPARHRPLGDFVLSVEGERVPGSEGVLELVSTIASRSLTLGQAAPGTLVADLVLSAAERVRPTLVAVSTFPRRMGLASAFASGPVERIAFESTAPVLVARRPFVPRTAAPAVPVGLQLTQR
jgi:hypothetical protein